MKKVMTSKWFWVPMGILGIILGVYFYKAQYKGVKQEIRLKTDIELTGLLLKPETPGPHPAIILLHGAGGRHQHHNKAFFRFHANAFLEKGFAVLVYTKRGSGDDGFNYDYFTYKDLANDAYAAIKFLRKQQHIDQKNIGLMGVSESGWFTPELAYLDGNIKFIINRVSSPFSVENTVIHEVKMDALTEGFTETEILEEILPLTKKIWRYYIAVSKDPSLARGKERDEINERLNAANSNKRLGKWFQYKELAAYDSLKYATRGYNYGYDPLPFLEKIDLPILYVLAGKDKNIPTQEVISYLEKFRETRKKDIQIKIYPEASHYLYKWGLEDGPYEGWLYQEGYLETITDWAAGQVTRF